MPGRSLNDDERRLGRIWRRSPDAFPRPTLRSLSVAGGTGLRGLDGVYIPFRYPITAICGPNGAGKSTVLALTVLAFHSPENWHVHWENTQPYRGSGERTYYRFPDFFVSGSGDTIWEDVRILWTYDDQGDEKTVDMVKTATRWGRYNRRAMREVDYLPIGRVLPAHETSRVRSRFARPSGTVSELLLSGRWIDRLSYVLGRRYNLAGVRERGRFVLPVLSSGASYTGFNMGGGEGSLVSLFRILSEIPNGGFLGIEEVEVSLHPQAQKRLAEVLVQVCLEKRLQLVCTTHSELFLDSLPREARLLIARRGQGHRIDEAPSTRFAMYRMTGQVYPELAVYCEDSLAEALIRESIDEETRVRVKIATVGSAQAVVEQGVAHLRADHSMRSLCILDGDCTEDEIEGWLRAAGEGDLSGSVDYLRLPGEGLAPEMWILRQLERSEYLRRFAAEFDCSIGDAEEHVESAMVELDHHDVPYVLSERTNLDRESCLRRLVRAVALDHPQMRVLRNDVEEFL